ncbi:MAG TPA: SDR family oxidoreductase, partial [Stellaceae bacterium]
ETTLADWQLVLDINLTGAFLLSRAALPHMIAGGGGSIIFIASQLGRVGSAGRAAYCATKGALIQLAKVMAIDHAAQNIRVNTLSPGAVETQRTLNRYGSFASANREIGPKHVLGRLGRPSEIAPAAVYLASDAASFVTGSDLLVDGGYTAI